MNISAVGVTSKNIKQTVKFYETIGFQFQPFKDDEQHIESTSSKNGLRLMVDSHDLVASIIGEEPTKGNHSVFAIEFEEGKDVDNIVDKLKKEGYKIKKEPWNAFWGQRYSIVEDPDGYLIDLYSNL